MGVQAELLSGASVVGGPHPPTQQYCIAMQPICDADLQHVGDELLYRDGAAATSAQLTDDQAVAATARVCHIAFYEVGVEQLVGRRRLFFNAPRDYLLRPELLPPCSGQLVIEVLEGIVGDAEVLAALGNIRQMGFKIALDDFVLTRETEPLLEVADIVKVDMLQPFEERHLARYRQRGLTLLAEKVETMADFERARALGFELFQGYFYARAETRQELSKERSNNHAALFRLLSELHKRNADFKEIERIIVQDARLTFVLLRYANSAFLHYRGRLETIFQVLLVLGLGQVRNMVLMMLIANNGPASKLLLPQALTRASMCEHLAGTLQQNGDSAFLAGLLSMMGPLLGKSLPSLLEELGLSSTLIHAILAQGGPLGSLLRDVESFECARVAGWSADRIALFNRNWMKSQVWTTEVLSLVDESGAAK